jgi:hypothetical protein
MRIISHGGKKIMIVLAWREKFEKIPAWWGKVSIVLILHGGRKL